MLKLQIRMLGEEGGKDAAGVHEHGDDVFLKKIESHLLTQASKFTFRPRLQTENVFTLASTKLYMSGPQLSQFCQKHCV